MSERGSFTTEYIHCLKCFEAARTVLVASDKYLCSVVIPSWEDSDKTLPIIAGKIGSSSIGGEHEYMAYELGPALGDVICHELRIVVICDASDTFAYRIQPHAGFGDIHIDCVGGEIDRGKTPLDDLTRYCIEYLGSLDPSGIVQIGTFIKDAIEYQGFNEVEETWDSVKFQSGDQRVLRLKRDFHKDIFTEMTLSQFTSMRLLELFLLRSGVKI